MRTALLLCCLACGATSIAPLFAVAVGQRTLSLVDESRQRPVVTELWYPTEEAPTAAESQGFGPFVRTPTRREGAICAGRHPLVLVSHGTGGGRLTLEWMAAGLAERGYVVAAVDHWGNTYDNVVPEYFVKAWERPQDLSFALTQLLRDPRVGPSIDPDRVFAIGFSLGGYSVLALAGASMDLDALYRFSETDEGRRESRIPEFPQLFEFMHEPATREKLFSEFRRSPSVRDMRIKAAVALAPALGQAFTHPAQFDPARPPVLILAAEGDQIAPVKTNAAHYHQLMPGSTFELLRGDVGHFVFLNEANADLQERMPGLFKDAPSCDRRAVHERVLQLASSFFARHAVGRADPPTPR